MIPCGPEEQIHKFSWFSAVNLLAIMQGMTNIKAVLFAKIYTFTFKE